MTPAEKPMATERKRWFVLLAVNAMTLPIPVASPAKVVRPNASSIAFIPRPPMERRLPADQTRWGRGASENEDQFQPSVPRFRSLLPRFTGSFQPPAVVVTTQRDKRSHHPRRGLPSDARNGYFHKPQRQRRQSQLSHRNRSRDSWVAHELTAFFEPSGSCKDTQSIPLRVRLL